MVPRPRLPKSSLSQLVTIVAVVLAVDLLVASAVFVIRLDDPEVPDFRRTGVAGVDWTISPYRKPSPVLGFRTDIGREDRARYPDRAARYVIGALARFEGTSDRRWLLRAEEAMDDLLVASDDGLLAHRYKATDLFGRPIPRPWYAADTQGVVLSALARLYDVTGEARWRDEADEVFSALGSFQGFFAGGRPAPQTWLAIVDRAGYVWFDRFSTGLTSTQVLTEQLWTLLGVYDYRRALADRGIDRRKSNALLGGSLATVEHYFDLWRRAGRISVSSIAVGNHDVREHFVAAEQLAILAAVTGQSWAIDAAQAYDRDRELPYFPLKRLDRTPPSDPSSATQLANLLARTGRPPAVGEERTTTRGPGSPADGDDPLQILAQAVTLLTAPASPAEVTRGRTLVEQVTTGLERGLVPHERSTQDAAGETVQGTWYSAATQGMLLSALTKLQEHDADPRWQRMAETTFRTLTRVRDYGRPSTLPYLGLVDFSGYLWFDHNLGSQPSRRSALEHAVALVGLHDYYVTTGRGDVYAYFAGGVTTLRDALPSIRRRGEPLVSELSTGRGDTRQHRVVAAAVASLDAVTADATLAEYTRLLRKDLR